MSVKPTAEWVVINVKSGETPAAVAGALLAIAKDHRHVRTVRGGASFLVHPDVAIEYIQGAPSPKPVRRTRKRAVSEETEGESA